MDIRLDVDDVLCNFVGRLCEMYCRDWDDDVGPEDFKSWNFSQYVRPECGQQLYVYLDMQEFYDGLELVDDAVEGVNELIAMGHDVAFVSALMPTSQRAAYLKTEWLKRHFPPLPIVLTKAKHLVRGDVLLDDGLHNLATWPGRGVLFSRPWNQFGATYDGPVVRSWVEFVAGIRGGQIGPRKP